MALTSVGCVSTQSTVINPSSAVHPATSPSQVVIYSRADEIRGKYEEIALLNSRGDSIWRSENAMLESIRESAAKVGANGVIMDAMSEPGAGAKVASFLFFGFDVAGRKDKAVAIYVLPRS
jgi:hypothetical protein